MPRFRVRIHEQVTYEFEVEAETAEAAREGAEEAWCEYGDPNKNFVSVDERDVGEVRPADETDPDLLREDRDEHRRLAAEDKTDFTTD
jgi:hypothetical protein